MKNITILFLATAELLLLVSCKQQTTVQNDILPLVSVKASSIIQGDIENLISFNGKTIYLKKNLVVSPIAGYIVSANAKFGKEVQRDEILFEIQTRESKALGSAGTSAGSVGTIKVSAPSDGFVNELIINETGGYVVEGGSLCSIVNNKDLMVQLNVPFEYNAMIRSGKKCKIILPDNTIFNGAVYQVLSLIDEANQTQSVLIKPESRRLLPENLNLTIQFILDQHLQTFLVSRSSLMTNETQSTFWVMKIINDSLAVKIPVIRGIENDSIAEIISPLLNKSDLVISEGAYGLPDSTIVKIVK
ncbi:MAG: HlyD family efflux transporter periplasmic adaptor subunit [Bacteroidales bacterium]|nr:HlyD family efflux transporter periplasmic adaptor subunit [Bacteroidales bacterium]